MKLHKSFSILLSMTLFLIISSCNKVPETDFSYAPSDNPEAGLPIVFENTTVDGSSFSWTFGEGGFSSVENPTYIYDAAGTYDVKLTATNDAGEQAKIKSITITEPTNMGFYAYDSTGTILLVGADVLLYDNRADWENFAEPLMSMITDAEGKVLFTNLVATIYYIWVIKEESEGLWAFGGWADTPIAQNETSIYDIYCLWFADEAKSSPSFDEPIPLILRKD